MPVSFDIDVREPVRRLFAGLVLALCLGGWGGAAPSEEADTALAAAERAVEEARARQALWTTAVSALKQARTARAKGDFAATVQWSKRAQELSELGLLQRENAAAVEGKP